MESRKIKLGLIVNPLAGIGGRVGLKGSDGKEIVLKAFELGAVAEAPGKAKRALERLRSKKEDIQLLTYPGPMGQTIAEEAGFKPIVIGSLEGGTTSASDTEAAAGDMLDAGVDLLLFAGGDGTARNVFNAIGGKLPVIGIPAGVKIHSAVYADTPAHAGDAASLFLDRSSRVQIKDAEVMDIDEEAFRNDRVSARLYGYMKVPNIRNFMQSAKAGSISTEKETMVSIASHIISNMDKDTCYFMGPGTTIRTIMESLGLKNTLLGVDAVLDGRLIGSDLNESGLIKLADEMLDRGIGIKVVVTVIGGQGYVFGRGNQQLSHKVLRKIGKENIIIAATESKMIALGGKPLLVDTGDTDFNEYLSGYVKVITSMNRQMAYKVSW